MNKESFNTWVESEASKEAERLFTCIWDKQSFIDTDNDYKEIKSGLVDFAHAAYQLLSTETGGWIHRFNSEQDFLDYLKLKDAYQLLSEKMKTMWDDFDMAGFAGYYSGREISKPGISYADALNEYKEMKKRAANYIKENNL